MTSNRQSPGQPTGGQFAAEDRAEPDVHLTTPADLGLRIDDAAGNAFTFECHPDRLEMWANARSDLGLFIRSDGAGGLEAKIGYGHDAGSGARDQFFLCTAQRLESELLDLDEYDSGPEAELRAARLTPLLLVAAKAQFAGR